MAIKITTTSKAAKSEGVKLVVYGPPGVGKTVLCSTAPDPIIISLESGLKSLISYDIPVIVIKKLKELRETLEYLRDSDEAKQYKTICIDSLSEIAEQVLSKEKSNMKDTRQAYGTLTDTMVKLIKEYRDLPKRHVYFSCKENDAEKSGVTRYFLGMPGSRLTKEVPYFFDEVFHFVFLEDKNGKLKRRLQTKNAYDAVCKDRSGTLDKFEKPNLTTIIEKILSGKKV